ncbi:prephenate dehydratase [Chitinispirillales bacterium ANBcel5]|uniref:prephenate dehydratase n=1 Tax=Cellulosispirillum alkaliphilum TaxID=3039283 RepID=UPI002A4FB6C7|nr:prephenate dehydratase [Chitinispirillales bacterium ANBcel5]
MSIAFAGERGAFTELAAREYFRNGEQFVPYPEFENVFKAVARGKESFGVVPIENSFAGSIHQNYDLLLESKLYITGEIFLRINHHLIANKGTSLRQIRRVYSHPQAFAQCKTYLKKFGKEDQIAFPNTALAVKKIRDEKLSDAAAVASMQAAIDFDMQVLDSNIEDNPWNTTRFLIVSKKRRERNSGEVKTSVVFSVKNIPGALFKALSVFALRDIDLYKIESRPVHTKGFQYLFYLDCKGDIRDESLKNAVSHLREITTFYRLLGSYSVGREVNPKYKHKSRSK